MYYVSITIVLTLEWIINYNTLNFDLNIIVTKEITREFTKINFLIDQHKNLYILNNLSMLQQYIISRNPIK